jgi:hypothetical protein
MPTPSNLEYGELQLLGEQYMFFGRGDEAGRVYPGMLYSALNLLAMDGWELVSYFEETAEDDAVIPVWVMRRSK